MSVKEFGKTSDGIQTKLYTIENEKIQLSVCDYGATLVSLIVKEQGIDVVQGFTEVKGYEVEEQYMGKTIGRVCNRIEQGFFTLNDEEIHLAKNNHGNSLHGGAVGFDKKMWSVEADETKLKCTYVSKDGEEGYPGNCLVTVIYSLLADGVRYEYYGESDKDTLLNITNHAFFNLDGPTSDSVLDHQVQLCAQQFAGVDQNGCTHEEIFDVKGTAFDFSEPKALGQDIQQADEQLRNGSGYDHHFLVEGKGLRKFLDCQGKSITMSVYSDCPGFHMYTANFLKGTATLGKEGGNFPPRSSVCFETQYYPNAMHTKNQEKPILRKGEQRHHTTEFRFK